MKKSLKEEANRAANHPIKCLFRTYRVPKKTHSYKTHKASKSCPRPGGFPGWFRSFSNSLNGHLNNHTNKSTLIFHGSVNAHSIDSHPCSRRSVKNFHFIWIGNTGMPFSRNLRWQSTNRFCRDGHIVKAAFGHCQMMPIWQDPQKSGIQDLKQTYYCAKKQNGACLMQAGERNHSPSKERLWEQALI